MIDRPANFIEPTLLVHEDTTTRAAQEEIFGPVLLGIPFDQNDLEGLIAMANATRYGLAASVWTRDLHLAHKIASHLEAGLVSVNDHATIGPHVPLRRNERFWLRPEVWHGRLCRLSGTKIGRLLLLTVARPLR